MVPSQAACASPFRRSTLRGEAPCHRRRSGAGAAAPEELAALARALGGAPGAAARQRTALQLLAAAAVALAPAAAAGWDRLAMQERQLHLLAGEGAARPARAPRGRALLAVRLRAPDSRAGSRRSMACGGGLVQGPERVTMCQRRRLSRRAGPGFGCRPGATPGAGERGGARAGADALAAELGALFRVAGGAAGLPLADALQLAAAGFSLAAELSAPHPRYNNVCIRWACVSIQARMLTAATCCQWQEPEPSGNPLLETADRAQCRLRILRRTDVSGAAAAAAARLAGGAVGDPAAPPAGPFGPEQERMLRDALAEALLRVRALGGAPEFVPSAPCSACMLLACSYHEPLPARTLLQDSGLRARDPPVPGSMHPLPPASTQRAAHAPRGSGSPEPHAPATQADPRTQPLDWLGGGLAAQLAQRRAAGAGAAPAGGGDTGDGGADAGYDERALRLAIQDKVPRQLRRLCAPRVWLLAASRRMRAGQKSWRALEWPGARLLWAPGPVRRWSATAH